METAKNVLYSLTQEEINQIAAIASKEAVKVYREEQKKAEKKRAREEDKVLRTKKLLSSYRRSKKRLQEEVKFTEEEEIEYRWKFIEDLMGRPRVSKSDRIIEDQEKKRQEELYCIRRIENALRLYKEECDKSSNEEGKRRFRILNAVYIDEVEKTTQELAEIESVSEKTVYRDIGIACNIMSVYLLGM